MRGSDLISSRKTVAFITYNNTYINAIDIFIKVNNEFQRRSVEDFFKSENEPYKLFGDSENVTPLKEELYSYEDFLRLKISYKHKTGTRKMGS